MTSGLFRSRRGRAPTFACLSALAMALACTGGEEGSGLRFEIEDSAGVAIALSREPRWEDPVGVSVLGDASVEIGVETGEAPYLLSGVAGASRLGDGSIVVCNGADATLRYYDAAGTFSGMSGGQGGGPAELRRMARCFEQEGETWVYQAPALPVKVFDESGAFARAIPMPRPNDRVAQLVGVSRSGRLLLRQDAPRTELTMGVSTLNASVFWAEPDGQVESIGTFSGGRWVRGERVAFPAAFSPSLQVATLGDGLLVGWPEHWDLAVLRTDGSVARRLRPRHASVAVTAEHRSALVTRILEGPMPGGDTPFEADEIRRAIVDIMEYPESLPAYYRVIVSGDDMIWVERGDAPRDPLPQVAEPYLAPTTWDIFLGDGEWLDVVELPGGFDPLEIGGTYVLGVHRDALGVERVRQHHLTKPAPAR